MRDSRFRRQHFNANGLAERIAILLVVAVVAGISIGLLMPKVNPTVGEMTGEYVATGSAAETLQSLTIDDQPSRAGYDRDSFGFRQTDDDGNGCDVREDVLARDLTDVRYIAGSGSSSDSGSGSGSGQGAGSIQSVRRFTENGRLPVEAAKYLPSAVCRRKPWSFANVRFGGKSASESVTRQDTH